MLCEGMEHLQGPYESDTSKMRSLKASYMVEEAYPRLDVDLLLNSRTWGGVEIEDDLDARLVRLTRHRCRARRVGHVRREKS